jgi:hypothetical protein
MITQSWKTKTKNSRNLQKMSILKNNNNTNPYHKKRSQGWMVMLTLCKCGLVGVGNIINKVNFDLQMFRFIMMFIPCFIVGKTHG